METTKFLNFLNEHYRIILDVQVNSLAHRFKITKEIAVETMLANGWSVEEVEGAMVAKYFAPNIKDKNAIVDKGAYRQDKTSDEHIDLKRPNEEHLDN